MDDVFAVATNELGQTMAKPAFTVTGEHYLPMPGSRSGWGENMVSGGPVAGLLAREIERVTAEPELQLARLTVDLFHPVPMLPLQVTVRTLRRGKRIHVVEAGLIAEGKQVTRAVGHLLRRSGP